MASLKAHLFALLMSVFLLSLQTEAGTWLSFKLTDPKTGGLETESRVYIAKAKEEQAQPSSEREFLSLLKECKDKLSKRSFIEQSKREAAMCRDLMDFVARRR